MKRFPRLIQCDKRGQLVIPKDIRSELKIEEGTGFWIYSIENEGLFLKKIDAGSLDQHPELQELDKKADKINVNKENVRRSVEKYKKTKEGRLDII